MEYGKWVAHLIPEDGGGDIFVVCEAQTQDSASRLLHATYPRYRILSLRPA